MFLSTANILQRVLLVNRSMHPMLPMLLKILWSYEKDQTARLQMLIQTSGTHGVGTFREKKGTGHYTTALTTLDKKLDWKLQSFDLFLHRMRVLWFILCTIYLN